MGRRKWIGRERRREPWWDGGGGKKVVWKKRTQSLKLPRPGIDRPIMWSSIYKNAAITANFMETFISLLRPLSPPAPACCFNRILIDRSKFDWAATELCNGCTKPRSQHRDRRVGVGWGDLPFIQYRDLSSSSGSGSLSGLLCLSHLLR